MPYAIIAVIVAAIISLTIVNDKQIEKKGGSREPYIFEEKIKDIFKPE